MPGAEGDRPDRDSEVVGDEMPPEPEASPGEMDRARLDEDDVSQQAP